MASSAIPPSWVPRTPPSTQPQGEGRKLSNPPHPFANLPPKDFGGFPKDFGGFAKVPPPPVIHYTMKERMRTLSSDSGCDVGTSSSCSLYSEVMEYTLESWINRLEMILNQEFYRARQMTNTAKTNIELSDERKQEVFLAWKQQMKDVLDFTVSLAECVNCDVKDSLAELHLSGSESPLEEVDEEGVVGALHDDEEGVEGALHDEGAIRDDEAAGFEPVDLNSDEDVGHVDDVVGGAGFHHPHKRVQKIREKPAFSGLDRCKRTTNARGAGPTKAREIYLKLRENENVQRHIARGRRHNSIPDILADNPKIKMFRSVFDPEDIFEEWRWQLEVFYGAAEDIFEEWCWNLEDTMEDGENVAEVAFTEWLWNLREEMEVEDILQEWIWNFKEELEIEELFKEWNWNLQENLEAEDILQDAKWNSKHIEAEDILREWIWNFEEVQEAEDILQEWRWNFSEAEKTPLDDNGYEAGDTEAWNTFWKCFWNEADEDWVSWRFWNTFGTVEDILANYENTLEGIIHKQYLEERKADRQEGEEDYLFWDPFPLQGGWCDYNDYSEEEEELFAARNQFWHQSLANRAILLGLLEPDDEDRAPTDQTDKIDPPPPLSWFRSARKRNGGGRFQPYGSRPKKQRTTSLNEQLLLGVLRIGQQQERELYNGRHRRRCRSEAGEATDDIDAVFWDIALKATDRKNSLNEELGNLPAWLPEAPDVFADASDILEMSAPPPKTPPPSSATAKLPENIFRRWKFIFNEPAAAAGKKSQLGRVKDPPVKPEGLAEKHVDMEDVFSDWFGLVLVTDTRSHRQWQCRGSRKRSKKATNNKEGRRQATRSKTVENGRPGTPTVTAVSTIAKTADWSSSSDNCWIQSKPPKKAPVRKHDRGQRRLYTKMRAKQPCNSYRV